LEWYAKVPREVEAANTVGYCPYLGSNWIDRLAQNDTPLYNLQKIGDLLQIGNTSQQAEPWIAANTKKAVTITRNCFI
jgi:hypothetical protein